MAEKEKRYILTPRPVRRRHMTMTPEQRERERRRERLKGYVQRKYQRNKDFYEKAGIKPSGYYKRKEFED